MYFEILFFISLFGVGYSYFIYPIILIAINTFKKSSNINNTPEHIDNYKLPLVSFIITAYNEEKQIAKKIENTLSINYPSDNYEIIVASDGSTDKTASIVENYSDKGVLLHQVQERKGKENAQRSAIQIAKGEILVFSDVSTQIENDSLQIIANKFKNQKVGALSSEDRFITENGEIAGEGAYVKYEMWLRKLESNVNSLVGLSGSFFAARKEVCEDWNISVPSDFNTAINCITNDYIAITVPNLLGYYPNLKDETKEYQRKVRTVLRGMAALFSQAYIMNPFKYKLFSFQVVSHKLMRWLVPWFLLLTLISNFMLFEFSNFYQFIFLAQCLFYTLAFTGYISKNARKISFIKIIYFFVQVNLAILQSTMSFLFGERITLWEPSKR